MIRTLCMIMILHVFIFQYPNKLLILPEYLSSPHVSRGVRFTRSLVFMYVLLIVVCPFVLFLLAIVLSVLLPFTDSEYPFSIFKLFSRYLTDVFLYCLQKKKEFFIKIIDSIKTILIHKRKYSSK